MVCIAFISYFFNLKKCFWISWCKFAIDALLLMAQCHTLINSECLVNVKNLLIPPPIPWNYHQFQYGLTFFCGSTWMTENVRPYTKHHVVSLSRQMLMDDFSNFLTQWLNISRNGCTIFYKHSVFRRRTKFRTYYLSNRPNSQTHNAPVPYPTKHPHLLCWNTIVRVQLKHTEFAGYWVVCGGWYQYKHIAWPLLMKYDTSC